MSFKYGKKQITNNGKELVLDARSISGYIAMLVALVDELLPEDTIVFWDPTKNKVTTLREPNTKGTRDEDYRQIEMFKE